MRKQVYILVISLITSFTAYSQYRIDYGLSVGASNYLGEIGGGDGSRRGGFADMKLDYTRWNLGGFYRYRISPKFGIKGALNYIRLSADDAKTTNPGRKGRNLNFKNDMLELAAQLELYIYKVNDVGRTGRYSTDFNLYVFGGVGAFYSNPKGELDGKWYALQPLQTEGVSYNKINFSIPVGLGFYYTIQRKYRLGLEFGWRTTFTDYIDDVSDKYVLHTDPLVAQLANKNDQSIIDGIEPVPGEPMPTVKTYEPGDKRGDPEHNDSYATLTVNFSWAIRGRSNFYRSKHNWVLGKNKRKRRKSRAKF
ncbi:MAG: outer membrane beta-barrel protein [Flavobacteriales bacterium]|nr:outer membrane beta-barrel protein [Flavobacteriales bacterium]MCB9363079.1 outer membrane beta-barrel protein [Flavobacteriales bacterium]